MCVPCVLSPKETEEVGGGSDNEFNGAGHTFDIKYKYNSICASRERTLCCGEWIHDLLTNKNCVAAVIVFNVPTNHAPNNKKL